MPYRLAELRAGEFERIFHPRSIAVVGVSRDGSKMGSLWAKALMESRFRGPVYAVNPAGGEFLGTQVYTSVKAIRGPVDLVISCIPRAFVLDLLDDCAAKKVAAVHFYTAGFRETGEPEWLRVEEEMARRARAGGFRIIGPNCIGVSCPEHELPYGASTLVGKPGPVGFISQSGGHAGKVMVVGLTRGLGFSRIASVGNCCDLGCADFLEYMAVDPGTGAVGLYLEGPRDTRRLLQVMRATSERKPVVVWKGGATEAGARAASSHTGAMRTSAAVWTGALRQAGAIEVRGVDEMADTLLMFQMAGPLGRANAGIICGLTGDGESEALLAAGSCRAFGIDAFPLSDSGRRRRAGAAGRGGAAPIIPSGGDHLSNVSRVVERATGLAAADRRVDIILVYENIDMLIGLVGREAAGSINSLIVEAGRKAGKPLVVVSPPGSLEADRLEIERRLSEAGVPVYPSVERAARAMANVRRYARWIGSYITPSDLS